MAIPATFSRNGVTIYPVTIPQAIIDPETGEPAKLGNDMDYTFNNTHADENGNFTITSELVGAAPAVHTHTIASVTGLQASLDGKSNSDHTHTMVTGIEADGSTVTGNVQLRGTGNVQVSQSGSNLNITITPYLTDRTASLIDVNSSNDPIHVFVGTDEEWLNFRANMAENTRYLVLIRS